MSNKKFYIYKLYFESGATYVGSHIQSHEDDKYVTSSSYYFKHPEDKVIKREIMIYLKDKDTMDILETICICGDKAENDKNVNYNLGNWFHRFGSYIHSEDQKKKISESVKKSGKAAFWKGKKLSDSHKESISKVLKGRPCPTKGKKHSEETKRKMSESHKKVVHTEEWNKHVSEAHKGKVHSEEWRQHQSESMKGKKLSEETKKKLSKAGKGRVHSEETKKKMSENNGMKKLAGKVFWWTNGKINVLSGECPEGFWRGMTKNFSKKEKI